MKTDKRLREHMEEFERLWKRFQGSVNVDSRTEGEIVLRYLQSMIGEMLLAIAGVNTEERVQKQFGERVAKALGDEQRPRGSLDGVADALQAPVVPNQLSESLNSLEACCPSRCVKYGTTCVTTEENHAERTS